MLVSHRKKFIFTKTAKTAGTSVESYFEPWCMPEGEWEQSHERDEYVSETGIIGYRGVDQSGATWFNHMSAVAIRDLLGQDVWDEYFRFTIVRNPYDKMVSAFLMLERYKERYGPRDKARALARRVLDRGRPIDRVTGRDDVARFRSWVRKGGVLADSDKYLIDGEVCVDHFIRMEALHEGVREVCDRLDVPFEPERIPRFKDSGRKASVPVADFYDAETERIVGELFAWEVDHFGYTAPSR